MVARNQVGAIEPSSGFQGKLAERLRLEQLRSSAYRNQGHPRLSWGPVRVLALSGAVAATLGVSVYWMQSPDLQPPSVASVAVFPLRDSDSATGDATPAFVSSVSMGMAIVPALMLAEEVGRPVVAAFRAASLTEAR